MSVLEEIPLSGPDVDQSDIDAVVAVLRSPQLSLGPRVPEFEAAIARYVGATHAIAINSGTSGLHLVNLALGLGPGDEVVTTPFSFVASSNSVLFVGATPVFADIDPQTWDLDPSAAAAAVTPRTRALLPVHVFGRACPMPQYLEIAKQHQLVVIEDSCEALGTRLGNRLAGTFGTAGLFAFYPNKQMTTGEGGIVVTEDGELAEVMRSLRNQGRGADGSWLAHERLGFNFRLPDILCALGTSQLRRIEQFVARRQQVFELYNQHLSGLEELSLPAAVPSDQRTSWFVYVVALREQFGRERRDAVLTELKRRGIGCRNYFAPIHLQPFYRDRFGLKEGMFPVTESVAARTIALPFFNQLSSSQVERVAQALREALAVTRPTRV